jgi:hypothetical protein
MKIVRYWFPVKGASTATIVRHPYIDPLAKWILNEGWDTITLKNRDGELVYEKEDK